MSHPIPGREYGENEYPDKGYRPGAKKKRSIHAVGIGHGVVKGPENMKRNPVLSPKTAGLSKRQESGVGSKLMQMAKRLKGLQETKHFGAKRRARHQAAKKAKLTGSKIPF